MSGPPRAAPTAVQLVVMAKAPLPGRAKTRLAPALGSEGAARLAQRMLVHTLTEARASGAGPLELCVDPAPDDPAWRGLAESGVEPGGEPAFLTAPDQWAEQGAGDLGVRMDRIVRRHTPTRAVLIMGTDCPVLNRRVIAAAAAALATHDAALVPVEDGGYVLIGLRQPCAALFADMPWSTGSVSALTRQRLAAHSRSVWLGPLLTDVDEPADLRRLPPGWI